MSLLMTATVQRLRSNAIGRNRLARRAASRSVSPHSVRPEPWPRRRGSRGGIPRAQTARACWVATQDHRFCVAIVVFNSRGSHLVPRMVAPQGPIRVRCP